MRTPYLLVLLPALVGAALGIVAYLLPSTGVTGTGGALLALIGAVAVAGGALLAMVPAVRGWGLGLLSILLGLGALLTSLAAWFLMQNVFAIVMALAFLGVLIAPVLPDRRSTP